MSNPASAGAGRDGSRLRELRDELEADMQDQPLRLWDGIRHAMRVIEWLHADALGQISDKEAAHENLIDMLQAVEWVRQSAGNLYACPFCHGITERDGGPGHADDCRWLKAVPDPLASDTGQAPTALKYENVWIVTEYEGGGIRGVFVSQGDAEAEIVAICSEHRDLTRSDFVIQIDRVRRGGASAPLASSSAPQGENKTTKI